MPHHAVFHQGLQYLPNLEKDMWSLKSPWILHSLHGWYFRLYLCHLKICQSSCHMSLSSPVKGHHHLHRTRNGYMLNVQSKTIWKHLFKFTDFFFKKFFQREFIQTQKFFFHCLWDKVWKKNLCVLKLTRHTWYESDTFFIFSNICLHTLYFLMSQSYIQGSN